MKALVLAVAVAALLAPGDPALAMLKCPQPDGSILSVPESMGCSTESERARQRAEQELSSQRRRAEQAEADAERNAEQAAEARRQQGADFVRASAECTRQANRRKFYNDPAFKSAANADGTVRMLGTAQDRFDFQSCMEQRGHRLESK